MSDTGSPRTEVNTSSTGSPRTDVRPAVDHNVLAFWFFLGSEVILFGALILAMVVIRVSHADQYADFRSHLSIPLIGVNTLVLIVSSYFVVRSVNAAKHGRSNALLLNLLVVFLLGAVFIAGQAYEWSTLFGMGIKLDSTFGSPFYIVTGIHGTHVLVGLAWASVVLLSAMGSAYDSRHYRGVEIFGLYWHFVDIVWIVLFSLIYLV
ncbi:MAG TPA: heme-copper oxidase subunit III [Anaerolineaceae bacterium]|nr:heme-copper oxidase subunit III [Anaerolineaceae bacterium]